MTMIISGNVYLYLDGNAEIIKNATEYLSDTIPDLFYKDNNINNLMILTKRIQKTDEDDVTNIINTFAEKFNTLKILAYINEEVYYWDIDSDIDLDNFDYDEIEYDTLLGKLYFYKKGKLLYSDDGNSLFWNDNDINKYLDFLIINYENFDFDMEFEFLICKDGLTKKYKEKYDAFIIAQKLAGK